MARCKLDIEHPKFVRSIGGNNIPADLLEGLKALRDKVAEEYKRGWFDQPMPGYPKYQNKIWKWDFSPEGATSATRKGWRLLAYVPDSKAQEPIPAQAFHCYSKSNTKGYNTKQIAKMIQDFLAIEIDRRTVEVRFRRTINSNGTIFSHCLDCYEMVASSADEGEVEILEGTHECAVLAET